MLCTLKKTFSTSPFKNKTSPYIIQNKSTLDTRTNALNREKTAIKSRQGICPDPLSTQ